MAKYVLGEEGAQKFKRVTQLNVDFGNTLMHGKSHALDNAYPHPYEVRWSSSLLSTDGEPGGYMMWLPDNCFYMNLSAVSTSGFPQIAEGDIAPLSEDSMWYILSPDALDAESPWPNEFDIWMNIFLSNDNELSGGPIFSTLSVNPDDFDEDEGEKGRSIHITHIKDYRPIPSVKSAVIIGNGRFDGKADEKSVALSGDILSSSASNLSTEFHLHHFHDNENDLSVATLVEGDDPPQWSFNNIDMLVRQRNAATEETEAFNELYYIDLRSLLDKQTEVGGGGGGSGGGVSSLAVDEQSVSKGGDGWAISSETGYDPALHMWNFHGSAADVDNPEMCDIVLRYNPDRAAEDKWLRYISYENLLGVLSNDVISCVVNDITGNNGSGSGDSLLSALSSELPSGGMFTWTPKTKTIGPGGCMVGRRFYNCTNGIGSDKPDALYQLRVTINSSGTVSLAVVNGVQLGQPPTTTQCWIPIYNIVNGLIDADYRGAFVVPAYD